MNAQATPAAAATGSSSSASVSDLGLQLQRAALGLYGEFVSTGEDGVSLVNYEGMRGSEGFAQYVALTHALRGVVMRGPGDIGDR